MELSIVTTLYDSAPYVVAVGAQAQLFLPLRSNQLQRISSHKSNQPG